MQNTHTYVAYTERTMPVLVDALESHVDLIVEVGSHSMRRVDVKSHDIVFTTLICYEECGFQGWSAVSASHFDMYIPLYQFNSRQGARRQQLPRVGVWYDCLNRPWPCWNHITRSSIALSRGVNADNLLLSHPEVSTPPVDNLWNSMHRVDR